MQQLLALFARANFSPPEFPLQPVLAALEHVVVIADPARASDISDALLSIGLIHTVAFPEDLTDLPNRPCDVLFIDAALGADAVLLTRISALCASRMALAVGPETSLELGRPFLMSGALDHILLPTSPEHLAHRLERSLTMYRSAQRNTIYQRAIEQYAAAHAARVEEMYLTTLTALANTLDLRDPHTHGHSTRVAEWTRRLALHIGLPPNMVKDIVTGAALHDIGKLAIPDAVLLKPDRLTVDEYELIKTHSIVGWRLLSPILSHAPVALNVIRWHHERLDASGYPDNLPPENIPIEARLVAVADTFDAMTMGRPYAVAKSQTAALAILKSEAGKLFDPTVVSALETLVADACTATTG